MLSAFRILLGQFSPFGSVLKFLRDLCTLFFSDVLKLDYLCGDGSRSGYRCGITSSMRATSVSSVFGYFAFPSSARRA
jgi:hypothetical protein